MVRFCPDPLWDANLTWYTDNPDFTDCFQKTILVYLPALLLLICTPLQIQYFKESKDKLIPWTPMIITKVICTCVLICLPIVDLIFAIVTYNSGHIYPVDFVADLGRLVKYSQSLGFLFLCKKLGLVSSGPLFFFWVLDSVCEAIIYRSAIISGHALGSELILTFVTGTIRFPFVASMLFLNCWADAKPIYISLEGQFLNILTEYS
jgi:ATP-binding cassette, subfamily C (CFTR/MRP), member 1